LASTWLHGLKASGVAERDPPANREQWPVEDSSAPFSGWGDQAGSGL